ncbi:MAG: ABC transporter ATP-binding protein [Chitinophagales bacterium]|nr:ABC transporter ATP-binding protein [Chitinophagales bacterium]
MQERDRILSVNNLKISFAGEQEFIAVENISFHIDKGRTLAIVGESGSGKSLTALSLMGLLPPGAKQEGIIVLATADGTQDISTNAATLRGSAIGMVFQEPMSSLNPVMRIGKQVTEAIMLHRAVSEQEAKTIAIDWLRKVKLPEPDKIYNRYPHQLSGGQKQRVMIAMAMCNNPALLIADEPTTALDVTVQKEVIELMRVLQKEEGAAMVFITHDLALAAQIADDVLVMQQGKVMEQGPVDKVLQHPEHPYTKALLACRPSAEHKGKRLNIVADFLDGDVQGKSVERYDNTITDIPILEVNKLKVWFETTHNWMGRTTGYYKAVDDVSFVLKKGEVLGLVGESGCGKSTISKSLVGLLPVHEGQVMFNGKDLATIRQKEWRSVRKDIQMIFQDPFASLNPRMSVGDMLMEPLEVHHIVPRTERKKEAQRLLDIVQLPVDSVRRYPHQFSGGQRQRLGIARALAVRPKLLICDESVSALDVSVQAQILNLLKDLQSEFDLSYLFISHDLNVVHYISDRVMVMQTGKIVETGNAEQVLKHPANDYTKKLIEAMP